MRPFAWIDYEQLHLHRDLLQTLLSFEFTENFRSNLWVAQQDIMPYDKCSQYLQGIANVPEDAKKSLLCTTNVDGGACNVRRTKKRRTSCP